MMRDATPPSPPSEPAETEPAPLTTIRRLVGELLSWGALERGLPCGTG